MRSGKALKIAKWSGIGIAVLMACLLLIGFLLRKMVSRERIEAALESALGRRVSVASVSADLFAVISGISIRGLRISDSRSGSGPRPMAAIPEEEACLDVPELAIRVKLLPLLAGRLVLRRFALRQPGLRLTVFSDGSLNISDLLAAGQDGRPGPLRADALPLALSLKGVDIASGSVLVRNDGSGQTTRIDIARLELPGLEIDPRRLAERNGGEFSADLRLRSEGQFHDGGFSAFDLGLQASGRVRPFSPLSGELDPRVEFRVASAGGSLSGIKVVTRLNDLLELAGYGGADVPEDIAWDRAAAEIAYESGRLLLKNGLISGNDGQVSFSGECATPTGEVDLELGVRLDPSYTPVWRSRIRENIRDLLPASLRRYVDPELVAGVAMASLAGKDGRIFMKFSVGGSLGRPRVRLLEPYLPSLAELAKAAASDYLERKGDDLLRRGLDLLRPD